MNAQTETVNRFVEFASINVNEHVKKKVGLSYLSWPWAVDQLLRSDPLACWEYDSPTAFADGTMMVFCTVTAFGISRRMQLPVMDHRCKAIANPNAFEVNTAMQRCLVKAIALHGLGLYIYTGEDLPMVKDDGKAAKPNTAAQVAQDAFDSMPEEAQQVTREWAMEIIALVAGGDADKAAEFIKGKCEDQESKLALWSQLPSDARSAIKKAEQVTKA